MALKKIIATLLAASSCVAANASHSAGVAIDTPLSVANSSITNANRFHHPNGVGNNTNIIAVDTMAQKDGENINQLSVAASIEPPPTGAIPPCEVGDSKTPVPIWKATLDKKTNLPWEPPTNDGQIIYIQLSAPIKDEIKCNSKDMNSFEIRSDYNDVLQGGVIVNIIGNAQRKKKICDFSGFYMSEIIYGMHQGWTQSYFGAVGEKELALSNRYCLSKLIQSDATFDYLPTSAIPVCKSDDQRISVPFWRYDVDDKNNVSSMPPINNGQIVFAHLFAFNSDKEIQCSDKISDSFRLHKNIKKPSQGGVLIKIRGNSQYANGTCYFSGFYVNKNVRNLRQGWISGQLEPVDKKKMALSDRYCLSK